MECVFALFPRKTRGWRWIAETSDYHVCSRKFAVETDGRCSAVVESYDRAHVLRSWQIITGGLGICVRYVVRYGIRVSRAMLNDDGSWEEPRNQAKKNVCLSKHYRQRDVQSSQSKCYYFVKRYIKFVLRNVIWYNI